MRLQAVLPTEQREWEKREREREREECREQDQPVEKAAPSGTELCFQSLWERRPNALTSSLLVWQDSWF